MNDNFDDDSHDDNYGVDVDHTTGSHKYQVLLDCWDEDQNDKDDETYGVGVWKI